MKHVVDILGSQGEDFPPGFLDDLLQHMEHDADGRALHADVGDARNLEACCAACRDAPTCSSFAFADERGDCTHFYTAAPPNDLLRFKLPSATFAVASFTRNEFIDATIGGFKVAER